MADAIEIVAGLKEQKRPSNPQKHSLGNDVLMRESAEVMEEDGQEDAPENQNQEVAA
jgi:hypothetical protein